MPGAPPPSAAASANALCSSSPVSRPHPSPLTQDSLGNYYDCRLTLQPAVVRERRESGERDRKQDAPTSLPQPPLSLSLSISQDPVATPAGYLYSREAILKCLLDQKQEAKRKLAAWEAAGAAEAGVEAAAAAAQSAAALAAFERQATAGASDALAGAIREAVVADAAEAASGAPRRLTAVSAIASNRERAAGLKANWGVTAANAPEARAGRGPKPDVLTRCPASGKPLRMKDLIPVRFTREEEKAEEEEEGAGAGARADGDRPFAVDPITGDALTNASSLVLIKPTGDVMLKATYEACVKPEGRWGGSRVRDPEDVIPLKSGGTGFAAHDGGAAEAKRTFALGPGTGRADVRGQAGAGGSKFGLRFAN